MKSAAQRRFRRLVHRLILPTRSFTTRFHLISFCLFLYQQSLSICLSERHSESQPIRSWIWFCFLPCQFQVKLTSTLGWFFRAWRTLALEFQCVDFSSTNDNRALCVRWTWWWDQTVRSDDQNRWVQISKFSSSDSYISYIFIWNFYHVFNNWIAFSGNVQLESLSLVFFVPVSFEACQTRVRHFEQTCTT